VEWVASQALADALGLTSSTVRQDLSHLAVSGISKRGYDARRLEEELRRELGGTTPWKVVIVGAGNLGCALAAHEEFAEESFDVCGLFDSSPRVVGRRVGRLTVQNMAALPGAVRARKASLGILAVPAAAAQEVADRLVSAGVRGLLNLARSHIHVPAGVAVVDARILEHLQELSCLVRLKHRKQSGETRS